MRVLKQNKNATLSDHALGARLAERNVSTLKISSIIVIAPRGPHQSRSLSAQRRPSHSLTRPPPSEPLSYRLANPQAEGPRSSDSSSLGPASIRADTDDFAKDVSAFDNTRSEDYSLLTLSNDQQRCDDFFSEFLNNVFTTATTQGRLPPPLPDIGFPNGDPSDPYLAHPFQVSPAIDMIISSLVADPFMDQILYAQAMNGDFLNGGLEAKLDSVMVSGPSETELSYYRTFIHFSLKLLEYLTGALCSHAIFLIVCKSNADGTSTHMDLEPNTTTSRRGDAGMRRPLREDACGEHLHHFNPGPSTRSFGGSIRKCRRLR